MVALTEFVFENGPLLGTKIVILSLFLTYLHLIQLKAELFLKINLPFGPAAN